MGTIAASHACYLALMFSLEDHVHQPTLWRIYLFLAYLSELRKLNYFHELSELLRVDSFI